MQNTSFSLPRIKLGKVISALSLSVFFSLLVSCSFNYSPGYRSSTAVAPPLTSLNDWLYRGSQPKENFFTELKSKGIRTVVNFREEPGWIEWERKRVEDLGMNYVSLPWNITKSVDPKLLDRFFEILDDPKNRPVFFHCKWGRDRSGVMSTLALMHYEKLSEAEARELALETIHPNLRYRPFVNQKIAFFLKARPAKFSSSEKPASHSSG